MKTFRQWFDNLRPDTQQYLIETCYWINPESKDGYNHPSDELLKNELGVHINTFKSKFERDRWLDSEDKYAVGLIVLRQHKDAYDHDTYITLLRAMFNGDRNLIKYMDAFELREIYKQKLDNEPHKRLVIREKLLLTEDFDNIDWSDTNLETGYLNDKTVDFLGREAVIAMAKQNPRCINFHYGRGYNDNSVFDELFFCENGWTPEQKKDVLKDYNYSEQGVRDFMERIVAVDESYLRLVGTYFIYNCPALGMHLYKEKKTPEELNALPPGHKIEEEYRYPKSYRKLFQIAACCARNNVGKAMAGTIGDAACILKMYGYDFNKIFDCLYPQYAEEVESTEATATV